MRCLSDPTAHQADAVTSCSSLTAVSVNFDLSLNSILGQDRRWKYQTMSIQTSAQKTTEKIWQTNETSAEKKKTWELYQLTLNGINSGSKCNTHTHNFLDCNDMSGKFWSNGFFFNSSLKSLFLVYFCVFISTVSKSFKWCWYEEGHVNSNTAALIGSVQMKSSAGVIYEGTKR